MRRLSVCSLLNQIEDLPANGFLDVQGRQFLRDQLDFPHGALCALAPVSLSRLIAVFHGRNVLAIAGGQLLIGLLDALQFRQPGRCVFLFLLLCGVEPFLLGSLRRCILCAKRRFFSRLPG